MSNSILFRSCNSLRTAELTDAARLRMLSLRQLPWQPSKAAFIQGGGWYTGGPVSKVDLVQSYLIHTGARADRDHLSLVEVLKNSSPVHGVKLLPTSTYGP